MAPSSQFSRRRVGQYCAAFAAVTIGCAASGCSSASWQQYKESPANPVVWFNALLPPEGETFYSDQAQEIDHSLRRE